MQVSFLGDKQFENPQTGNLNKIIKDCVLVRSCLQDLNKPSAETVQPEKKKKAFVCKSIAYSFVSSVKMC